LRPISLITTFHLAAAEEVSILYKGITLCIPCEQLAGNTKDDKNNQPPTLLRKRDAEEREEKNRQTKRKKKKKLEKRRREMGKGKKHTKRLVNITNPQLQQATTTTTEDIKTTGIRRGEGRQSHITTRSE
jgi:hypothetical protein